MFRAVRQLAAAGAACRRGAGLLLKVILHIGAHRTGTTTLQRILRENQHNLSQMGILHWGPERTRSGLFAGLVKHPERLDEADHRRAAAASALIRDEIARLRDGGAQALIVSEENMIGSMRDNLDTGRLYPGLRPRLDRFRAAFAADCTRVVLALRSYDGYWASALAYAIPLGQPVPDAARRAALAEQPRSWRRVLTDAAAAFPRAEIVTWDFDRLIGHPAAQLAALLGAPVALPAEAGRVWQNASAPGAALRRRLAGRGDAAGASLIPDAPGRWQPFAPAQVAAMRMRYAEDLEWLRAGAAGLARLIDDPTAGEQAAGGPRSREGQSDDARQRGLGAAG
jgi:hypothetical protein